jgi:hypothetical protein
MLERVIRIQRIGKEDWSLKQIGFVGIRTHPASDTTLEFDRPAQIYPEIRFLMSRRVRNVSPNGL